MPRDKEAFIFEQKRKENNNQLWIIKPCNRACGIGIKIVGSNFNIYDNVNAVISKYLM